LTTYTTSTGIEIEFLPISQSVMLRFHAAHPEPSIPTYSVHSDVTGTTDYIPLDAKSLASYPDQFTPEQHQKWREYQQAKALHLESFIRFFAMCGIKVKDSIDGWVKRQEFVGIPIPDDSLEREYQWITSYVIRTQDDFAAFFAGVMRAAGISEDLLKQVEDMFRGPVQENSTEQAADPVRGLDV
jgi:hypothetical protein